MSNKPVFDINQKLFNQLNDWQKKNEAQEKAELEVEANQKDRKISDAQKQKNE